MNIFDAIRGRRSIRRYKREKVPLELIEQIIEAGQWAPTGKNLQYWKFIAVTDPCLMKMVKTVSPMLWGESPAAILICLDLKLTTPLLHEGVISSELAGFPAQNMMLAAHALGIGTCAIGGFNREAVKELLEDIRELKDRLEKLESDLKEVGR